ncbi:MBOAT family protein [Maricurvus nonylphenolicus]|uniref:MBOAT family O-acyltransferase n=1 Tax=Maricurvus nonylphenolicus TaxID=1008307 RepID=UPI0036F36828
MIFSSNVFLFVFLPVFLTAYYATPERYRSWIILFGSYCFYAWWRVDFLLLFVAVTLWNYLIGLRIEASLDNRRSARFWVTFGVVLNLSTLGYFKYVNFGVATVNAVFNQMGMDPWLVTQVILPIGISFYIFQAISYIIDVYRKDTPATHNLIDFAAFIALFPQLIAGPVLRYKDVAHQFQSRTHSVSKFSEGVQRFMLGFIKKVIIADSIAPLVNAGFALENPTMLDTWVTVLAYTAQLYFDFSGYADMAIGLGLMMGFKFVENFKHPYISQSITEFWRRWHISLSSWLRDYLYVPLGGNRNGKVKTYRNLLLTMILGGFWHGANWTFLVWGIWHGSLLAIEKAVGLNVSAESARDRFVITRWVLTLFLVMLGWVVFRAETITSAMTLYAAMFDFSSLYISEVYAATIRHSQLAILAAAWVLIVYRGFQQRAQELGKDFIVMPRVYAALLIPLFFIALLKLSAQSYSAFLYFQF